MTLRYSPKTLVPDLVRALQTDPSIRQYPNTEVNILLTPTSISFEHVEPKYISTAELLSRLNLMWMNKIFLGTNGYYSFGNISKDGKIMVTKNGMLDITLPFHKINTYQSYLLLNNDILKVFIEILEWPDLLNLVGAYPSIKDLNIYGLLTKERYPYLYDDIVEVLNNALPDDKIPWWGVYADLVKSHTSENVLYTRGIDMRKWYKDRYAGLIATTLTRRNYPALYERLKSFNTFKDFEYDYISFFDITEGIFSDYAQTSIIPTDYVFNYRDIALKGNFSTILALMMRDGLEINFDDLVKIIALAASFSGYEDNDNYNFYRFLRLSNISKDVLNRVLTLTTGPRNFDYAQELIREYLKD